MNIELKAKDLRLGNLYRYLHEESISFHRVSTEFLKTLRLYETDPDDDLFSRGWFPDSIPIDEECLFKFGFELKHKNSFYNYQLPNGWWISMWMDDDPCAGFEEKGVCYWGEGFLPVRTVHQLQNLYHAVTGGLELELITTTKAVYEPGDKFKCLKEQSHHGVVVCAAGNTYECVDFTMTNGVNNEGMIIITAEQASRWLIHTSMAEFNKEFRYLGK